MKTLSYKYLALGLLGGLSCIITSLNAEEKEDNTRNPIGCYNEGYVFDMKVLRLITTNAGPKQSLYFLYNTSAKDVTLYHMRGEESTRSMYLNHSIGPSQWGVLSTSEQRINYICAIDGSSTSYGTVVDCADYLRVCQYTHVKYGLNNQGNYWLINSSSKNAAVNSVVHYGIIPGV